MPPVRPFLSAKLISAGFRHGFFGRVGGQSEGTYTSLNCSYSVGDDPQHVGGNLSRIAQHLGLVPDQLKRVSQVHGCAVMDVRDLGERAEPHLATADALVSTRADSAVCIRTADCIPILVGCRATGAAAAIHAGWRGVVAEIIPRAIERLLANGARRDALVVAIGPHIGPAAFEVSDAVAHDLEAVAPAVRAVIRNPPHRPHVRLAALAVAQLTRLQIQPEQIDALELCTFSMEREFFSYRRDGERSGRHLNVIRPLQQPRAQS